jgi:hypothetical protein
MGASQSMSIQFNWGALEPVPSIQRVPGRKKGKVLFFVRNGNIEFPQSDRTVWPWSAISAVGYLNVEPIAFDVDVNAVTSKDGIEAMCIVQLEVQLKNEPEWRLMAANRQSSLGDAFNLAVADAAQRVFKRFDYKALFLKEDDVRSAMKEQIGQEISNSTPYAIRRILLDSVASVHPDLDKSIRVAKATEIGIHEVSRTAELDARLESDRVKRLREAEKDDAEHEYQMQIGKAKARHIINREQKHGELEIDGLARDHELDYGNRERLQALEWKKDEDLHKVGLIGSLVDKLNGNDQFYMMYSHPELYAKMQMSDSQSQREVAIALQQIIHAQAHDQGVTATLQRVMEQLQIGLNMNRFSGLGDSSQGAGPDTNAE